MNAPANSGRWFRRIARVAVTGVIAFVLLVAGVCFLDWRRQDAASDLLRDLAPETQVTVRYRHRFLSWRTAAQLRSRYAGGGPLPFDRPWHLSVSGRVNDATMARVALFSRLAGSSLVLQIGGGASGELTIEELTDEGLAQIATLDGLQELRISSPTVPAGCTDAGCSVIAQLPRLRKVELHGLPAGDLTAERFASLPALRDLHMNGSQITDAGLEALTRLSTLRRLQVHSSRTTREGAWAFRLVRREVIFGGPNIPERVTSEEFLAYRREHERLRLQWGGPGPSTGLNDRGR